MIKAKLKAIMSISLIMALLVSNDVYNLCVEKYKQWSNARTSSVVTQQLHKAFE